MPRPPQLCVVGSTNVDLHLTLAALPLPGETVLAEGLLRLPGGKGANQAVAAARLGGDVRLVSAVGDDHDGHWSLEQLRAEGVDTRHVAVVEAATGTAVVMVELSSENAIVVVAGANELVTTDRLDLEGCDALLLSLEIPLEVALLCAEQARARGVPVVLNAAPAQPLPPELLTYVDVLVVNETELGQVGHVGETTVVVTLGAAGAEVREAGVVTRIAAPFVEAVDTVGAGDCFAAALALAVAEGGTCVHAATTACHAASLSVTQRGARTGFPNRQAVAASLVRAGHAEGWPA